MAWYDHFIEFVSKFKPIDISLIKVENKIEKIVFGNSQEFKVVDGFIEIGKDKKIKVVPTEDNINFILPNGNSFSRKSPDKEVEIHYLDEEKRVFTRSDIVKYQTPFLSIEKKHEEIIRCLKPYLEDYRDNADLGSLLIASTIVRMEDELQDKKLIGEYYKKLHVFKKVGHMIYNFLRSGILEKEILPYLQRIMQSYETHEEIKRQFLMFWLSIIRIGYPTAYFAKEEDTKKKFYSELKWRFERGEKEIEIYSRTSERNKQIAKWLKRLKRKEEIAVFPSKPYKIGYSKALKFRITRTR